MVDSCDKSEKQKKISSFFFYLPYINFTCIFVAEITPLIDKSVTYILHLFPYTLRWILPTAMYTKL
jgi:hypothetical protein